ncbi:Thioredoxin-like fold protein [Apiospora arundinis]|jgi:alkyl hydroperoxide reductase 1|uniref:Peroxiredoxin type-2 n=1 Tax=Apiospora arundinis TaxID=335852 RepID=A0ABR2HRB2_9PEZI
MPAIKSGDAFPQGVTFSYIAPTPETSEVTACGIPTKYDASKEFQNKKVVLVSVPGAFTPTCQADHISGYKAKFNDLKAKGVDQVVVIAYNDPFVMSAWGKANSIQDESIIFATDDGTAFSQSIGWTLGERTGRYAVIVDHGKVTYAENEPGKGVTVSGADAVLAKL